MTEASWFVVSHLRDRKKSRIWGTEDGARLKNRKIPPQVSSAVADETRGTRFWWDGSGGGFGGLHGRGRLAVGCSEIRTDFVEEGHQLHRQGEDDGGVFLHADLGQGLQVT